MKSKLKTNCKWTSIELFGGYYYGFCPNKIAWDKEMARLDLGIVDIMQYPSSHGRTTFFSPNTHNVKDNGALVTINEGGREPIQIAALIVHEAVHIKQAILESVGEDNVGHETEAYLVQRIAQDLMYMYAETRIAHE